MARADYIIGNPPFLGGKLLRRELGDKYVDDLFALYKGRVKAESDLVVYWFEKARAQIAAGSSQRAGLLATQGIRGGANRAVLERIQKTGTIFWAWSDRKWLLQGAAVHVSMIAFERAGAANVDTAPSANGATSSQPGAQPQENDPTELQRAEGPIYGETVSPSPSSTPTSPPAPTPHLPYASKKTTLFALWVRRALAHLISTWKPHDG